MNQLNLPKENVATIKEGVWYVLWDGDYLLHSWFSSYNGKEKVYLNGNCVSENRSMKKLSVHEFSNFEGDEYRVEHQLISLAKAKSETTFYKNGRFLKAFRLSHDRSESLKLKNYWPTILIIIIGLLIVEFAQLDDWFFFAVLLLAAVIQISTMKSGKFIIEEVTEDELLFEK